MRSVFRKGLESKLNSVEMEPSKVINEISFLKNLEMLPTKKILKISEFYRFICSVGSSLWYQKGSENNLKIDTKFVFC